MSATPTILREIIARKWEEVAAGKAHRSLSELDRDASGREPPRGFDSVYWPTRDALFRLYRPPGSAGDSAAAAASAASVACAGLVGSEPSHQPLAPSISAVVLHSNPPH